MGSREDREKEREQMSKVDVVHHMYLALQAKIE